MRTGALAHEFPGKRCCTHWAGSMAVWQYGRNNRHRFMVIVDQSTNGKTIDPKTFSDFSEVTLACEDKIKDWHNV